MSQRTIFICTHFLDPSKNEASSEALEEKGDQGQDDGDNEDDPALELDNDELTLSESNQVRKRLVARIVHFVETARSFQDVENSPASSEEESEIGEPLSHAIEPEHEADDEGISAWKHIETCSCEVEPRSSGTHWLHDVLGILKEHVPESLTDTHSLDPFITQADLLSRAKLVLDRKSEDVFSRS